jgi:hypothetical protein
MVAVDATGVGRTDEKHCEHCLHKTSKNGKTTYFHNVLAAKLICSNGFSISLGTSFRDKSGFVKKNQIVN